MIEEEKKEKKLDFSFLSGNVINEDNQHLIRMKDEPSRFFSSDFERLLLHCHSMKVKDIFITSEDYVKVSINGGYYPVTIKKLDKKEIEDFIIDKFDVSIINKVNGEGVNAEFFIKDPDDINKEYRFRVNFSSIDQRGRKGIEITMRVISEDIPFLKDMKLPPDLQAALLSPNKGIFLITGPTGSGKSTLLASILAHYLREPEYRVRIVTSEDPIEFTYDHIVSKNSMIRQSAVPSSFSTFLKGTESAMRRAPNIILIGEAKDKETFSEIMSAAITGHVVYTTLHSSGFVTTFSRVVSNLDKEERASKFIDLIESLEVCLTQRLERTVDGRVVALREYVVLNKKIKDILLKGGPEKIVLNASKVLEKYGHSFAQDAQEKYEQGIISKEVYEKIVKERNSVENEIEDNIEEEQKDLNVLKSIKEQQKLLSKQMEINQLLLQKIMEQDEIIKNVFNQQNNQQSNNDTKTEDLGW